MPRSLSLHAKVAFAVAALSLLTGCATVGVAAKSLIQPAWNATVPSGQQPNIIPAGDVVIVLSRQASSFVADGFNATNGAMLWQWNSSRWTSGSPLGLVPFVSSKVPDLVFFIELAGPTMVALELDTGSVRWNYSQCIGACSYLPVVSDDGAIIFFDDESRSTIRAVEIASGVVAWTHPVQYDYGFTASECGRHPHSAPCLVVLQAFNASSALIFLDGLTGDVMNVTNVTHIGAYRREFSFPVAADSVVTFLMGPSVLGYSTATYDLLWNLTSAHYGYQFVVAYPSVPKIPVRERAFILLAGGSSLAARDAVTGKQRWNVSAETVCVDRLPSGYQCGWSPNVFGLLEPLSHAVGVYATCSCWNRTAQWEGFSVNKYLALNTSNGALLWSQRSHTDAFALVTPSRTFTAVEEADSLDVARVYDSESFTLLQEWRIPDARTPRLGSSSTSFFLLTDGTNGTLIFCAFRRDG